MYGGVAKCLTAVHVFFHSLRQFFILLSNSDYIIECHRSVIFQDQCNLKFLCHVLLQRFYILCFLYKFLCLSSHCCLLLPL